MSLNFSGQSKAMCACGNASRSRSNDGVVITASPSQLTPRTRIRLVGRLAPGGSSLIATLKLQPGQWQWLANRKIGLAAEDCERWPASSDCGPKTNLQGHGAPPPQTRG